MIEEKNVLHGDSIISVSRSELLSLLDSEIHLISEQENREGWTSGALLGALGTLAWLLWESLTKETIGWENSLTLLLILFIARIAYSFVKEGAGLTRHRLSSKKYRHVDPYLASTSLLSIPINLAWIWLAVHLSEQVPIFAIVWTVFVVAILFLIGVAVLIFNYLRIPLSASYEPNLKITIGWYLSAFACAYSAYGYSKHLVNFSLYDLKIAVLIFAGLVLLEKLNSLKYSIPYQVFISIRRQLVLGQLDTEAASRQTDIALLGMQASDVFRFEVEEFLSGLSAIYEYRQKQNDILDGVLDNLRKLKKPIPVKILDDVNKQIEECKKYHKLCSDRQEPLRKGLERLFRQESLLTFVSKEEKERAKTLWDMVNKSIEDVVKQKDLCEIKIQEYKKFLK